MEQNIVKEIEIQAINNSLRFHQEEIENLEKKIAYHQAKVKGLYESLNEFLQEEQEAQEKKISHPVVFVNTDNLNTTREEKVEVHGPNCRHLAKWKTHPLFEVGSPENWSDPQSFFNDYNGDFYHEGGNEACWSIAFFPCTKMVKETTVVSEYK